MPNDVPPASSTHENPYRDEIIVSWPELHRDARYLSSVLHRKGDWKGIIAITRGGLVPAALIGGAEPIQSFQGLKLDGDIATFFLGTDDPHRPVLFGSFGRRSRQLSPDDPCAFFGRQVAMHPAANGPSPLGLLNDLLILHIICCQMVGEMA